MTVTNSMPSHAGGCEGHAVYIDDYDGEAIPGIAQLRQAPAVTSEYRPCSTVRTGPIAQPITINIYHPLSCIY